MGGKFSLLALSILHSFLLYPQPRTKDEEEDERPGLKPSKQLTNLCSLDIWRGALDVIYAPKVATGLSPGFSPGLNGTKIRHI
jgi:hypothetical protein